MNRPTIDWLSREISDLYREYDLLVESNNKIILESYKKVLAS